MCARNTSVIFTVLSSTDICLDLELVNENMYLQNIRFLIEQFLHSVSQIWCTFCFFVSTGIYMIYFKGDLLTVRDADLQKRIWNSLVQTQELERGDHSILVQILNISLFYFRNYLLFYLI